MSTSMTKEIQEKELNMLLYFKEFCNKHNLRFYLCGGGLIGAIRHNGFIPWDDDLD
ncbi:MAG: LicD family protein, partial [Veillonella parvula]|nr:LicD family protein [Veillonella parvula]